MVGYSYEYIHNIYIDSLNKRINYDSFLADVILRIDEKISKLANNGVSYYTLDINSPEIFEEIYSPEELDDYIQRVAYHYQVNGFKVELSKDGDNTLMISWS